MHLYSIDLECGAGGRFPNAFMPHVGEDAKSSRFLKPDGVFEAQMAGGLLAGRTSTEATSAFSEAACGAQGQRTLDVLFLMHMQLREEVEAIRRCLERRGIISAVEPLIKAHRDRFECICKTSEFTATTSFKDIALTEGIVDRIGLNCGRQGMDALRVTAPRVLSLSGVADAKLVICGGFGHDGELRKSGEAYDFRFNTTWQALPPMRVRRVSPASAVHNGKLYVAGGVGDWGKTMECYDLKAGMWQQMPSMSTVRCGHSLTALGDYLYACGGVDETLKSCKLVERFDPSSVARDARGTWSILRAMPEERSLHVAGSLAGRLIVCGGCIRRNNAVVQMLDSARWYDPKVDEWSVAPSLSCPRESHAGVVVRDALYICGGFDGIRVCLPVIERFHFAGDPNGEWEVLRAMPFGRQGHRAEAIAGHIYVFGGTLIPGFPEEPAFPNEFRLNSVMKFNTQTQEWTAWHPIHESRAYFVAGVLPL